MIVRGKSTLRLRFYSLSSIAALIFLFHGHQQGANLYSWTGTMLVVFFLGYMASISKCEKCGRGVLWTDDPKYKYVRQFTGTGTNFFGLVNKCPYCEIKRH
jgi:hydrogenase/urease accessory protein HupE